jgi:ABC-type multidrug transport system permease subunit
MFLTEFSRRQYLGDGYYSSNDWVWYAVKYAVIAGILAIFLVFFIGGYLHAKRRMKRGLPLLAYHRVC